MMWSIISQTKLPQEKERKTITGGQQLLTNDSPMQQSCLILKIKYDFRESYPVIMKYSTLTFFLHSVGFPSLGLSYNQVLIKTC